MRATANTTLMPKAKGVFVAGMQDRIKAGSNSKKTSAAMQASGATAGIQDQGNGGSSSTAPVGPFLDTAAIEALNFGPRPLACRFPVVPAVRGHSSFHTFLFLLTNYGGDKRVKESPPASFPFASRTYLDEFLLLLTFPGGVSFILPQKQAAENVLMILIPTQRK